jgi:uncharacterized membrane protein (UPF0127 family)
MSGYGRSRPRENLGLRLYTYAMKRFSLYGLLFAGGAALMLLGAWYVSGSRESSDRAADLALELEYATTSATRERGLSGRDTLAPNQGLLFVFPEASRHGIWMKDMLIPIDIFWLDDGGRVVSMAERVMPSTYPDIFYPSGPAKYVLEMPAGFGELRAIATGTQLVAPSVLQNVPAVSE